MDSNLDLAPAGAVADRVFKKVADSLREQLAMTEQRNRPGRAFISEARSAFVGERIVHLCKLGGELTDIEPAELLSPGERF